MKIFSKLGLFVLLSFSVLSMSMNILPNTASAGTSNRNVSTSESITKGVINEGDYLVSGKVTADGNYAVFNENCAENSKIVAKTKINNCKKYGVDTLFTLESTLRIEKFVDNGKFILGFGNKSLSKTPGSQGSGEIVFTDSDGGISMECNVYREDNVPTSIINKSRLGSVEFNHDFVVSMMVSSNMELTLTINNVKMAEKVELKEDMTGYIGFYSFGKNTAFAKGIKIIAYRYDNPENVDYTETFDNGYHSELFYSESGMGSMSPAGVYVKDGKLLFENAKDAYFSTRYTYSNFELTFDLSDLQVKPIYDENGNVVKRISTGFGIVFGANNIKETAYNTVFSGQWLHLEGVPYDDNNTHLTYYPSPRYILYDNGAVGDSVCGMEKGNIWEQSNEGKEYTLKFIVNDGMVSLSKKLASDTEDKFETVFSYNLGRSPVGYVKLFCAGGQNMMCNFKIDNLSIKNTDFASVAQKIENIPAFVSNEREKTPDFEYTTNPDKSDLVTENLGKGGCTSLISTRGFLASGMVLLLIIVGYAGIKNGRKEK